MKKAIITLSLICAGLLATSNIGDLFLHKIQQRI